MMRRLIFLWDVGKSLMKMHSVSVSLLFWPLLGSFLLFTSCGHSPEPQFKVRTKESGIYRVAFEDLPQALIKKQTLPTASMGLFHRDQPVPIAVTDKGDGQFNAGDFFDFFAKHLPGDLAYSHEYARTDAYKLSFNVDDPLRTTEITAVATGSDAVTQFSGFQHFERDRLLMRFPSYKHKPHEIWYWQKLSCTDQKPFTFEFELPDYQADASRLKLKLNFRGWSRIRGKGLDEIPDHELQLHLNGQSLGLFHWEEREPHVLEIDVTDFQPKEDGPNELAFSIPLRNLPNGNLAIDVVMLNWIEITYPQAQQLLAQPQVFHMPESGDTSPSWIQHPTETQVLLGNKGTQITVPAHASQQVLGLSQTIPDTLFATVGSEPPKKPAPIVPWFGDSLRNPKQQADYIMIAHPRLKKAIEPLADHHRAKGKTVRIVDVRHIYDNFNHGVVHPKAIRDFVSHAYHQWQKPSPEYLLLVGDASWDSKHFLVRDRNYSDNTRHRRNATSFSKILSTPYDEKEARNNRNLIPTANFFDFTGHSASDNYFVKVAGDDVYPDLAVGRLPVTKPEEVEGIVAKTIAYDNQAPVGPWRRRILMITNQEKNYQRRTDQIAEKHLNKTWSVEKIYPESQDKTNAAHTQNIVQAMDRGQNIIYFNGHGGRFIWRTGPPDIKKNHDLFTLTDMDNLVTSDQLSIVLSMTCYSAPFDHPNADSIGEKFLRMKDRGAVTFIGASWRNSPKYNFSTELVKNFTNHQGTVGEALIASKVILKNKTMVETYNLLGDPAVALLPQPQAFDLQLVGENDREWVLKGTATKGKFAGQGLAEIKFAGGTTSPAIPFEVKGGSFQISIPKEDQSLGELYGWQVYLWDEDSNKDWFALLKAEPLPGTSSASQP